MRINLVLIIMAVLLASGPLSLAQVDISDPNCDDAVGTPFCNIQAAIDAANNGDVISISGDTYNETITIPFGKDLTLQGAGSGATTIDGAGVGSVVNMTGVGSNVEIADLGITGGFAVDGGGIFNSGVNLTVVNTAIFQNTADRDGGGIFAQGGDLILKNTDVFFNAADQGNSLGSGGGLHVTPSATVTINDSRFDGNTAMFGGGISNNGTLVMKGGKLTTNAVDDMQGGGGLPGGGGLWNGNLGSATLNRVEVFDNSVTGNTPDTGGGGIKNFGLVILNGTTVHANHVDDDAADTALIGSGILNDGGSTLVINNSTVSGNFFTQSGLTTSSGGGIYLKNISSAALNHSTIANNQADNGGGIFARGSVTLKGTIVANQQTGTDCDETAAGSITDTGGSLDSDDTCNLLLFFSFKGVDPMLGSLVNNGGPTRTHNLLLDSPAIDGALFADCMGDVDGDGVASDFLATDQRGQIRVDVPSIVSFHHCDIGAVEFNMVSNGGMEDDKDGDMVPDHWQGTNLRPNDRYVCNPNFAHFGRCALLVRGRNNTTKEILQVIDRPGGMGNDPYELVVYSASRNAAANSLQIVVGFENTPIGAYLEAPPLLIATGTHPYQRFASSVTAPINYDQITVYAIRSTMTPNGRVLIDSVSLVPE